MAVIEVRGWYTAGKTCMVLTALRHLLLLLLLLPLLLPLFTCDLSSFLCSFLELLPAHGKKSACQCRFLGGAGSALCTDILREPAFNLGLMQFLKNFLLR